MGQLRVDERGRAFAGSQLQVQLYSARRHGELEAAITATLNRRGEGLVWHAPIETARFEDGLATLRPSGTALLIEGKSYPAEMRGSG